MSTEFKHIVRIIDKDLDGTLNVVYALSLIKGVGIRFADAVVKKAGVPLDKRLGFLTDPEIEKLEEIIRNPRDYDLPVWLLNRRKDLETGVDTHLITSDLDLRVKSDIEMMKAIRSWRGYRHAYGLKVRGQKTKTTGRTGKTLGVKKKALAKPAAAKGEG
ncbi:MAG: 30S ribosomal protein S13 [Candidatus Bathyarchaeia archaeon]